MALYDINGNLVANGGSSGSVTPESTTFVETIKGLDAKGHALAEAPTTFASNENWLRDGQNGWAYISYPFTGTVFVRSIASATNTYYSYLDNMLIVDNIEDINNNTFDTLETLECSERTSIFKIDGIENQQFIVNTDGSYEQVTGSYVDAGDGTGDGYGVLQMQKFEIPAGKYGFLRTKLLHNDSASGNSNSKWIEGVNAVFAFDISSNPIVFVTGDSDGETLLKITDEYADGFARTLIQNNPYFALYAKELIDRWLLSTTRQQTFGKSLWVGGDSLHAYAGNTICKYNQYFGFKTLKNDGYAGSTWTGTGTGGGIQRVTDLVANNVPYDVFILAWGTNEDSGGNGTIDDEASNAEGCTMVSAMKWCITQLRTAFRYSAIGVIIPPPKNTNDGMKEKGNLMIEVCKLLHVPYVDMREYLSMDDMSSDGVHLGYGANKYGAAEAKLILDICPYGDPLN